MGRGLWVLRRMYGSIIFFLRGFNICIFMYGYFHLITCFSFVGIVVAVSPGNSFAWSFRAVGIVVIGVIGSLFRFGLSGGYGCKLMVGTVLWGEPPWCGYFLLFWRLSTLVSWAPSLGRRWWMDVLLYYIIGSGEWTTTVFVGVGTTRVCVSCCCV